LGLCDNWRRGSSSFYKFGPVAPPGGWPGGMEPRALPRWYRLSPDLPLAANPGASITVEDAKLSSPVSDTLFYNPAKPTNPTDQYRYVITTSQWNRFEQGLPWDIGGGSSMTSTRGASNSHWLYVLRGKTTKNCKYRILGETSWNTIGTAGFEDVRDGGAITIGPDPILYFRIYALVGGNTPHFYRHTAYDDAGEGGMSAVTTSAPIKLTVAPNPFSNISRICFSLSEENTINLIIYDVSGKAIRKIFSGKLQAGNHNLSWDRKDDTGNKVSSGIYLLKFETVQSRVIEKVVVK